MNATERRHQFVTANTARQARLAQLGDSTTVSTVDGTDINVRIDGYGDIHFYTAAGSPLGGMSADTYRVMDAAFAAADMPTTGGRLGTAARAAITALLAH